MLSIFFWVLQQKIMRLGFDWDTTDLSIMLLAKLAKPLLGTARIVINSLHIKGDVRKATSLPFTSLFSFSKSQVKSNII